MGRGERSLANAVVNRNVSKILPLNFTAMVLAALLTKVTRWLDIVKLQAIGVGNLRGLLLAFTTWTIAGYNCGFLNALRRENLNLIAHGSTAAFSLILSLVMAAVFRSGGAVFAVLMGSVALLLLSERYPRGTPRTIHGGTALTDIGFTS